MREAAQFIAAQSVARPFGFRGLLQAAAAPLRWYLRRRDVRRIADLDDHLIADLGLERSDVGWALRMPLSQNAAMDLERRALERRHGFR